MLTSSFGWLDDADFTSPESGVWPDTIMERRQHMLAQDGRKQPYSPWADPNPDVPCHKTECVRHEYDDDTHPDCEMCRAHPDRSGEEGVSLAECGHDARNLWSRTQNYDYGQRAIKYVEMAPNVYGVAFLQHESDPFAYVDGDDVRCPESGEVHPVFKAVLALLGPTYVDVTQSGAGCHANYIGEIPGDKSQTTWQIDDEPWGENDDLPSIEIYCNKRVCVMTGNHVPGTPDDVQEWDESVLAPLIEANDDSASEKSDTDSSYSGPDPDFTPKVTGADEYTTDMDDITHALNRLDAREVAKRTIVKEWDTAPNTSPGEVAFIPTWGGANCNGTANIVNEDRWMDTGDEGGYGGVQVMALIDMGEWSHREANPRKVTDNLWWESIQHLRELGFDIPKYQIQYGERKPTVPGRADDRL